jgi:mannose-1-phosphate guanylyltransferase
MSTRIIPVILAGGQGKRLRPFTSRNRPKPFLKTLSAHSFYQDTLKRAAIFEAPVIVSEAGYADVLEKQNKEINCNPKAIILEPESRNTAAAIFAATCLLRDTHDWMLVLPSDHFWPDASMFQDTIISAAGLMDPEKICLIGITPSTASRRYGYIKTGEGLSVERFVEKPEHKKAREFFKRNDMLWNSGVFLCKPKILQEQALLLCPEIFENVQKSMENAENLKKHLIIPEKINFLKTPSISIDYALFDNCHILQSVRYKGQWDDIGTKSALLKFCFKKMMNK